MAVVLVNRPEPGASRTAEALAGRGVAAVVAPLFEVTFTGAPAPDGPFDALIVSSANGAFGLNPANVPLAPDALVFAVGKRTAAALADAGFKDVRGADGDQRDLARLVIAALPADRKLLYATGEEHKPGLATALIQARHTVAVWVRYRTEAAAKLPDAAREGLRDGTIGHVLHYSRRGAETFVALAEAAGVAEAARACKHLCLSDDTAEPLRHAGYGAAGSDEVIVAAHPDETSLLDALEARLSAPAVSASVMSGPSREPAMADDVTKAPQTRQARTTPASAPPRSEERREDPAVPGISANSGAAIGGATRSGAARGGLAGLVGGFVSGILAAGLVLWQGPPLLQSLGLRSPAPDPVAPLAARLAALETARANGDRAGAEAVRTAGELRGELQKLQAELAQLAARPVAPAGPVELPRDARERLDSLQRAQDALSARVQAQEPRLEAAERAASRVSGSDSAAAVKSQAAARLLLADRVARALDEGRGFAAEARALAALGAPPEPVNRLRLVADGDVPSRLALAAAFREVRPKLLVETPVSQETSLVDRLLRLTDGLVRVRATGSIEGVSPAALTARIDQALQRGDMAGAQGAFAQLPEPARRAGAIFEALLSRRGQAEGALKTIQDEAVTALAAP